MILAVGCSGPQQGACKKCMCPISAFPMLPVPGSSSAQCFPGLTSQHSSSRHAPHHQVQGAEEAQKERQRQKDLESNYRRVWGPRGGEGTGDLDEFDF